MRERRLALAASLTLGLALLFSSTRAADLSALKYEFLDRQTVIITSTVTPGGDYLTYSFTFEPTTVTTITSKNPCLIATTSGKIPLQTSLTPSGGGIQKGQSGINSVFTAPAAVTVSIDTLGTKQHTIMPPVSYSMSDGTASMVIEWDAQALDPGYTFAYYAVRYVAGTSGSSSAVATKVSNINTRFLLLTNLKPGVDYYVTMTSYMTTANGDTTVLFDWSPVVTFNIPSTELAKGFSSVNLLSYNYDYLTMQWAYEGEAKTYDVIIAGTVKQTETTKVDSSFTGLTLANCTTYYVYVVASDTASSKRVSKYQILNMPGFGTTAPTSMITPISSTEATITITDPNSCAVGSYAWEVLVVNAASATDTQYYMISSGKTSTTIGRLTVGTSYTVSFAKVELMSQIRGNVSQATAYSHTYTSPYPAPSAFTLTTAMATEASFSWAAPTPNSGSSGPIASYRIRAYFSSDNQDFVDFPATSSLSATISTGLKTCQEYLFTIRALVGSNPPVLGDESSPIRVVLPPASIPSVTVNAQALSSTEVFVTLTPSVALPTCVQYVYTCQVNGAGDWIENAMPAFVLSGLAPATAQNIACALKDPAITSPGPQSTPVSASTDVAPTATVDTSEPLDFKATMLDDTSMTLAWSPPTKIPTGYTVASYDIVYSPNNIKNVTIPSGASTTYTLSGLTQCTTYYLIIRANYVSGTTTIKGKALNIVLSMTTGPTMSAATSAVTTVFSGTSALLIYSSKMTAQSCANLAYLVKLTRTSDDIVTHAVMTKANSIYFTNLVSATQYRVSIVLQDLTTGKTSPSFSPANTFTTLTNPSACMVTNSPQFTASSSSLPDGVAITATLSAAPAVSAGYTVHHLMLVAFLGNNMAMPNYFLFPSSTQLSMIYRNNVPGTRLECTRMEGSVIVYATATGSSTPVLCGRTSINTVISSPALPVPVKSVTAISQDGKQINLSVNPGYMVMASCAKPYYRFVISSAASNNVATVRTSTMPYVYTGDALLAGTRYTITLYRSYSNTLESGSVTTPVDSSATFASNKPAATTAATFSNVFSSSFDASFTAVTAANSYVASVAYSSMINQMPISSGTSLRVAYMPECTAYAVTVQSVVSSILGPASPSATTTTLTNGPAMPLMVDLTQSAANSVTVYVYDRLQTSTGPCGDRTYTVQIQMKDPIGRWQQAVSLTAVVLQNGFYSSNQQLTPGTYRALAYAMYTTSGVVGQTKISDSMVTLKYAPTVTVPAAPTALQSTATAPTANTISVQWTAPAGTNLNYTVYAKRNIDGFTQTWYTTDVTLALTPLVACTQYKISVLASANNVAGPLSTEFLANTAIGDASRISVGLVQTDLLTYAVIISGSLPSCPSMYTVNTYDVTNSPQTTSNSLKDLKAIPATLKMPTAGNSYTVGIVITRESDKAVSAEFVSNKIVASNTAPSAVLATTGANVSVPLYNADGSPQTFMPDFSQPSSAGYKQKANAFCAAMMLITANSNSGMYMSSCKVDKIRAGSVIVDSSLLFAAIPGVTPSVNDPTKIVQAGIANTAALGLAGSDFAILPNTVKITATSGQVSASFRTSFGQMSLLIPTVLLAYLMH